MRLYNIDELKDSRIFFDKNPPRYMTVFIVFIIMCISFALVLSTQISKPYIIVASGTATTTDNRYVSVDSNGEIIEILKQEGEYVKKGDVLFKLSDGKENAQKELLDPQIKTLNDKLAALDIYERSLNDQINHLENKGQQQAYYGKMEYYLSMLESESFSKGQELEKINESENKLAQLKEDQENLQKQLNETNDTIKQEELKSKIESKKAEINAKQDEINEMVSQSKNPSSQAKQIAQQLFAELGADRSTTNQQLAQLKGQLNASESENEAKSIKAENEGIIHYLTTFKTGIAVQMNQTVAEISQNEDSAYIVEANILAKDISKINVGQKVNVELQGVNTQKYGTLKGKVEKISNGSLIEQSQQGNIIYYQCIISLDSTELISSKGESVSVVKSMPVQARIIYDNETYWDWLRELINLRS